MTDRPTLESFDNTGPAIYDAAERSQYSIDYLRDNIRVGFTSERGPAWWANQTDDDGNPMYLADGTHFDGPVPTEEVEHILNVTQEESPIAVKINGEWVEVPAKKAIYLAETQQVVNITGQGYVRHQYLDALAKFIDRITDGGAEVGSVGRLKNGAVAFIQAVLPGDFHVGEGSGKYEYVPYITGATSADSSLANVYGTGVKGAICDNTLDQAIRGFLTKFKIKHTKNSKITAEQARERLDLRLVQVADDFQSEVEGMMKIEVTERDFELWVDEFDPLPEVKETKGGGPGRGYTMADGRRDRYSYLWNKDPKVAPYAGTAFGIWQLANTYQTWDGIVRSAAGGRLERNYLNMVEGKIAKSDRAALDALTKVLTRDDRPLVLA